MNFEYEYPILSTGRTHHHSAARRASKRVYHSHSPRRHPSSTSASSKYSPSQQRQADLSRILDPSYASSSSQSSSSNSPASPSVYVDRHGEVHDPDFRPFPVQPSRANSQKNKKRRSSSGGGVGEIARPDWERGNYYPNTYYYSEVEEDEDEDEYADGEESESERLASGRRSAPPSAYSINSPQYRPVRSRSQRTITPPPRRSSPYGVNPYHYYSGYDPTATTVLSSSPEEESTALDNDPFEESGTGGSETEGERKSSRRKKLLAKIRGKDKKDKEGSGAKAEKEPGPSDQNVEEGKEKRESSQHTATPVPAHTSFDVDLEEPAEEEETAREQTQEWTPTCTQSIRRHWQALALRLRFKLFKTKRSLKKRLGK